MSCSSTAEVVAPDNSGNPDVTFASNHALGPQKELQKPQTPSHAPSSGVRHTTSSPSSLKRKRSGTIVESPASPAMTFVRRASPPPSPLPHIQLHDPDVFDSLATSLSGAAIPEPPSPVPTEIIEDPPTPQEGVDIVEAARAAGVKVRDFAYEPTAHRLPEVWHLPYNTLAQHDMYVRSRPARSAMYKLSGKQLYRLLSSGLVSRKEAKGHWRDDDWAEHDAHKDGLQGPYPFVYNARYRKPTAAYRKALRVQIYGNPPDTVAEELIYTPPDEQGMDDGDGKYPAVLPRAVSPEGDLHHDKKRRVGDSADAAPRPPVFSRPPRSTSSPFLGAGCLPQPPAVNASLAPSSSFPSSSFPVFGAPPPSQPAVAHAAAPLSPQHSQSSVSSTPPPPRLAARSQTLLRVQ